MSNRQQRRREVARFRSEVSDGLLSYLVAADDTRLAGQPLLRNAVAYWRKNIPIRRPKCFGGCRAVFADDGAQVGAFLLVTAAGSAPKSAGVSGLCMECWQNLPMPAIERAAERVLQPVLPR